MPKALKAVLIALVLLTSTTFIAVIALFVVAVTAGPSIAAGERAALVSGGIYVALLLLSTLTFGLLNRSLKPVGLILASAGYALTQFLVLAGVFLMNIVLLNR